MTTAELSRRVGRILGTHQVSPAERDMVNAAVEIAATWADLPADVRSLLEQIDARPGGISVATQNAVRSQFFASSHTSQTRLDSKFDPLQKRGRDGKWTTGDVLKLAGRIALEHGETFAGSTFFDTEDGDKIPLALTHRADGPHLRIGAIDAEDIGRWKGANKGGTADLNASGIRKLDSALAEMAAAGENSTAQDRELEARVNELDGRRKEIWRRQWPNMTKAQAKEFDKWDEKIDTLDRRIKNAKDSEREKIGELPPDARARWDGIDAEVEQLSHQRDAAISRYWADESDTASLDEYDQAHKRIVGLLDEQLDLHDAREIANHGSSSGTYVTRAHQLRQELDRLEQERDSAVLDRDEMAGEPRPLSPADRAELSDVEAQLGQATNAWNAHADDVTLVQGVIPGQWADLTYETTFSDVGEVHVLVVKPHDAPADWRAEDVGAQIRLMPDELAEFGKVLHHTLADAPANGMTSQFFTAGMAETGATNG